MTNEEKTSESTEPAESGTAAPEIDPATVQEYALRRPDYIAYASVIESILRQSLERSKVRFLDVQSRAKSVESFREKASRIANDGVTLKYTSPLTQLTDLAACRVIVFFPKTIVQVEALLRTELDVIEKVDHAASAMEDERLGYLSVHFLARLKPPRSSLPEYARFEDTVVEIQVRTVMQHAWAEIEHDIQYKSSYSVPKELARRFVTLAGLLEVADREFQSIQDRDEQLRGEANASVGAGQFKGIEVTPASLKAYLDRRMGSDGRMKQWSYEFATRVVKSLELNTIEQLDASIDGLDDDTISRVIDGHRSGQLTRFDYVLLAALKEAYIQKHPWNRLDWFQAAGHKRLGLLKNAGVIKDQD